jgi:hypothetical protein
MRKMTPRSYSRSTFSELKNQMRIIPKGTRNIAVLVTVSSMVRYYSMLKDCAHKPGQELFTIAHNSEHLRFGMEFGFVDFSNSSATAVWQSVARCSGG